MAKKRERENVAELEVAEDSNKSSPKSKMLFGRSDPDEPTAGNSGQSPDSEARREVNRCFGCRRKVGLMGFRCRCGDLFCSEHRYSDRHNCGFDYKAAGRAAIARENPVVRPAKILKV